MSSSCLEKRCKKKLREKKDSKPQMTVFHNFDVKKKNKQIKNTERCQQTNNFRHRKENSEAKP